MESRWIWPFELLDKIGEGGMGVVYRARYVGNNRMVAVKLVPDDVAANPTLVARFERELEVLKQLRHPNIVHCFGGLCESKQRFYAMELVEGGTLHSLLREVGKLPWETVVDYGLQMCAALQCAHEMNVVHRDVKPGNFLITKQGKLKLSDFGLAIVIASQRITSAGKTLGTFHYMAPEQIRGKPPVSNRTDLYALGCVFFEMLTGDPPFDAEAAAEVLHKHLKEEPRRVRELVPNCPLELDVLINDLLQKDAEARPATAALVAGRLRTATAPASTTVNSLSLTPVVSRSVVDADSSPAMATLPPSSPPTQSPAWLTSLLAVALVWIVLAEWRAWQWRARAAKTEAATVSLVRDGTLDVKQAALRALGQSEALQPATQRLLIEQLSSPDQRVRMAVVQFFATQPELAQLAKSELSRMQKSDEDPQIRPQAELALAASEKSKGGSLLSSLMGWLIPLVICGVLLALARYGWWYAKSHALIPGL